MREFRDKKPLVGNWPRGAVHWRYKEAHPSTMEVNLQHHHSTQSPVTATLINAEVPDGRQVTRQHYRRSRQRTCPSLKMTCWPYSNSCFPDWRQQDWQDCPIWHARSGKRVPGRLLQARVQANRHRAQLFYWGAWHFRTKTWCSWGRKTVHYRHQSEVPRAWEPQEGESCWGYQHFA